MQSSELQRCAEEANRNEQRLRAWRMRYLYRFGTTPDHDPALKKNRGFWHIYWMRQILRGKGPSNLPTGPEAA